MDDALQRAFRLLARRARSKAEIEAALERAGHDPAHVAAAIRRLEELGYVDDRKFARDRAEWLRGRGYGSLRVRRDLERAGVEERWVEEAAAEPAGEERERAREVLASQRGELDGAKHQLRSARRLAGRGFPEEITRDLLETGEL